MPSLSTSNGVDRTTISLSEVRKIFEALYIVRGIERYNGGPTKDSQGQYIETNERQFQALAMSICKQYGNQHLDSAGYPKETPKQAAANKV